MGFPAITNGLVNAWCGKLLDGSHGGTYFDPVTKASATVTRATPATIYDPSTGRIRDVAANLIPLVPWGTVQTGGIGYAPVIEEARTNFLVNSYGAANDGSKWTTGWSLADDVVGTPVRSLAAGVYGNTAQRITHTSAGDTNSYITWQSSSGAATFAAGEAATLSAYLSGSSSGVTVVMRISAYSSANAYLGTVATSAITLTTTKTRYAITYSSLPATTDYVTVYPLYSTALATGDTIDITIDACQLEKGAFATSYIPTTTAAATRNAVPVAPTLATLPVAEGTIVQVCGGGVSTAVKPCAYIGYSDGSFVKLAVSNVTPTGTVGASGSATAGNVTLGTPRVLAMTWKANELIVYKNGTAGTADTTVTVPSGTVTSAFIGSDGTLYSNGPEDVTLFYNRALSAAEVASLNGLLQGLKAGSGNARKLLLLGM